MKRILALTLALLLAVFALGASAAAAPTQDKTAYKLTIRAAQANSSGFVPKAVKNAQVGDTLRVVASLKVPKGADLTGFSLSFTGVGADLWLSKNGASGQDVLRYGSVELSKNASDALKKSGEQGKMTAKAPFLLDKTDNALTSIDGLDNKGNGDLLAKLSEAAAKKAQTYYFAFYAKVTEENASVAVSLTKQPGDAYAQKYADVVLCGKRPAQVLTSTLEPAIVDAPYAQLLTAAGARPVLWTLVEGKLPEGLQLERGTGLITGTPKEAGTYEFSVRATANGTLSPLKQLRISVRYAQAPQLKSANAASNSAVTLNFTAPVAGYVNTANVAIAEKVSGRKLTVIRVAYPPDERAVTVEVGEGFTPGLEYTAAYGGVSVEFSTKADPLQERMRINPNPVVLKVGDYTPQVVQVTLFDEKGHPLAPQPVSIVKEPNYGFMGEHKPMMDLSGLGSGTFVVWWQGKVPAGEYPYLLQCGGYTNTLIVRIDP